MNKTPDISLAATSEDIAACYPVMVELRPQYSEDAFLETVSRLIEEQGYRLVVLKVDDVVSAVAGFRFGEWLHTGRYLEIDEFVTSSNCRSKGLGGLLFDWVKAYAEDHNCAQIKLVSGVKRKDAHRFYERKGMTFEAHYFSLNLA